MSISEKSVVDAEKLAIEEINKAGGVLGKQIEAIVEDGNSDCYHNFCLTICPKYTFFDILPCLKARGF
jgi:urea-binding protein